MRCPRHKRYSVAFPDPRLPGLEYIEVTAHFQQRAVSLPVDPATLTHDFIQLATSKLIPPLASKKFILFLNERVLSSGTLAEHGILDDADVYLVEDIPVDLSFAYHCENGRTRLFHVQAEAAVTISSLKAHLAKTVCSACPPMDMTNNVFEISVGDRVLSDDFHPAQPTYSTSTENCKQYTVHLLSKDKAHIRMKLKFQSDQRSGNSKTVLFVREDSTFRELRDEVARVTSFPRESVDICKCDPRFDGLLYQESMVVVPVRFPLDANISDHPNVFHHDCFFEAKEEAPLTLQVKADVRNRGEISLLRLKVHSHDTIDSVVRVIAEKMVVDCRLVRFPSIISLAEAIHEQRWGVGQVVQVDVFPRGAVVTIFHKDEAFRYETFVQDTATTKVRDLQTEVERKHIFCSDSVRLYLHGQLLDPDATLSSARVGMDSALMVSTKVPGKACADADQAPVPMDTPTSEATPVSSTETLSTNLKRPLKDRHLNRQRCSKRLKPASQTSRRPGGNDNEAITGSKALAVRATRTVVAASKLAACTTDIQPEDTAQSVVSTAVSERSNLTETAQRISSVSGTEQSTSEAGDGCGRRLVMMTPETNANFGVVDMTLRFTTQQAQHMFASMFSMSSSSMGPPLMIEQTLQPTTQVREEALQKVAQELASQWDVFASRGLGLCYPDIEAIRKRHPDGLYLQALSSLHKWKQSLGSLATKAELQKRLSVNEFRSIAELIENIS